MKRNNSNFRKPKGKGKWPKDSNKANKFDDREGIRHNEDKSSLNDISWYSRYPNLLQAAGSFPYPYRPGMRIPVNTAKLGTGTATQILYEQIPGVLQINWQPCVGYSGSATDPASIVAKEIYAKVRDKYSGALDADAPDFVIYLMALDSIFSYIAWLKRVYRTINAYSPDNYAMPEALLAAYGFGNPDTWTDLRVNRVSLWQSINNLVLASRKFTCPATMDIFNRHYWMSDNVYTDDMSINSQFYAFNLRSVYKYQAQNTPQGDPASGLTVVPLVTSKGSYSTVVDALYSFGNQLIESLVAWDDAYTINGYLARAYEGTPSFIVAELPQEEILTPVYVPEVLTQIENLTTLPVVESGKAVSTILNEVSQNPLTNAILSKPQYQTSTVSDSTVKALVFAGLEVQDPLLSIRNQTPTVADSVIASRLKTVLQNPVKGASNYTWDIVCGSEIIAFMRVFQYTNGTLSNQQVSQFTCVYDGNASQGKSDVAADIINIMTLIQFDWHPFLYTTALGTATATSANNLTIVGDIHNITQISIEDLKNLHRVCLFSEFNAFRE